MLKLVGFFVFYALGTLHWHEVCLNLVVYPKGGREPCTNCLFQKATSSLTHTGAVLQNNNNFAVKQTVQEFCPEGNEFCSILNRFLKVKQYYTLTSSLIIQN